jgi:tetratricopeptide (TPR) repeat protein
MKKLFPLIAVLLTCRIMSNAQISEPVIKVYQKSFTTYGFSDPDPILPDAKIYPYYRFDGYTNTAEKKSWTVVELENKYIRVMILPEIGGKIWGAWEKSTGKPFIYYNQVVKFRDVAMRGPWTSGGIEANYGIIGHTPNCATPVDYKTEVKPDGSVSCYIGTLDLLTETYWTIEINLPKDQGSFTTRSFWHNSTSLEQSYYTWMNAGIKAAGNLQFIYPGTQYLGHNGEHADWNINAQNGRDISFYDKNDFGGYKSYHVFGKYTDFFGAFWHNDGFGMGRFALHDEKAGKKIWIWGLSPQGMIWDKLLTDTDGQYVEVQSGRLFNQASPGSTLTPFKHLGFSPASVETWTEHWFPVMNTQGFVIANPFGALNLRTRGGYLRIDFSPLQDMTEELTVSEGKNVLYSRTISFKTLSVFSDSLKFEGDPKNLIVTLGEKKLVYKTDPSYAVLKRPVDLPDDFEWNSVYGLATQAKEYIRQRFYLKAEQTLQACLAKDPHFVPALSDLSMLMIRNLEYGKALEYASHALKMNTYDPPGNYYYALANRALGNTIDAKDGFGIAALSAEFRSPSYLELSKLYFQENDLDNAMHYANKCLEVNSNNPDALQILTVIYRIRKDKAMAQASLDRLAQLNPLNHFIFFEQYRWQPTDENEKKLIASIQNELPGQSFLQLADWYLSLGQHQEGLEMLKLAPEDPMIYYWMAYATAQVGDSAFTELINKANALSAKLVFPFRERSAQILTWVMTQSNHWKPKYYAALIYNSRNNFERARELLKQCGNPDFAPFYATRATVCQDENFAADLQRAAALDPNEWRYGKLIINDALAKNNFTEALTAARQYHARLPKDFRISMLLAKALLSNQKFGECSDLLDKITILPYEGATDGRQLYREAWLMQAVQQIHSGRFTSALKLIERARKWPLNLGVGKPYDADIDVRLEEYMEAICFENTRRTSQAKLKWNAIIDNTPEQKNVNTLITALALKKSGRLTEGETLLKKWTTSQPEDPLAEWCWQAYRGEPKSSSVINDDENFRIIKALTQ